MRYAYEMKRPKNMPAAIVNHPGVQEVSWGPDSGIEEYKYEVWLKDGWHFSRGRMEGLRCGNFNTVADFRDAKPEPKA